MNTKKCIIKFEQYAIQSYCGISRMVGFVRAKNLIELIDIADLDANPRSAKSGSVTQDIIESIKETPEILPFKTKGVLIGTATSPIEMERQRFVLEFNDRDIEGILDGGHNTLAIAIYMLNQSYDGETIIKKVKTWQDMKSAWTQYKEYIYRRRDESTFKGFDFLVPLEVIYPSSDTEESSSAFQSSILDICAARNNNVQLYADTKANQAGHYDFIKKHCIDPTIRDQIIWKTNESGRIPVKDIVALAWIPLSLMDMPEGLRVPTANQIYSSKGACMDSFVKLMESESVSRPESGTYVLENESVKSALSMLRDLPRLYDKIYSEFPYSYNKIGNFGRIGVVKIVDQKKSKEKKDGYIRKSFSHFYQKPVQYDYPDGFIVPIVYGLRALMSYQNGRLSWKVNPDKFIENNLDSLVQNHKGFMEKHYDPQTVGKNAGAYNIAETYCSMMITDKPV
jgi:hypothetical protein